MSARIFQIGARAEGSPRIVAGEDDTADLPIVFELRQPLAQAGRELLMPGVPGFRPAQGQNADVVAFFVQQGHRTRSLAKPIASETIPPLMLRICPGHVGRFARSAAKHGLSDLLGTPNNA